MDRFAELRKVEKERLLSSLYTEKSRSMIEESEIINPQWANLLNKLPPVMHALTSTARRVLDSKDNYRIAWLGLRTKALYQGVAIQDILPGSWEDEADFYLFLQKMTA